MNDQGVNGHAEHAGPRPKARAMRVCGLVGLFLVHAVVTARASMDSEYLELFAFAFATWPARQLFSDLTVAMVLVVGWMIVDAKKMGRNPWPYVVASVLFGSFAPVAYLLIGELSRGRK